MKRIISPGTIEQEINSFLHINPRVTLVCVKIDMWQNDKTPPINHYNSGLRVNVFIDDKLHACDIPITSTRLKLRATLNHLLKRFDS